MVVGESEVEKVERREGRMRRKRPEEESECMGHDGTKRPPPPKKKRNKNKKKKTNQNIRCVDSKTGSIMTR